MKTSNQSKITSLYRDQSVLIRAVFERAGDTGKVLCVALDHAKRKQLALICDSNGDILKATFPVENNPAAARFPRTRSFSATRTKRRVSSTSPPRFARRSISSSVSAREEKIQIPLDSL